nr:MAG TPA: hypothetical protein [Caudoviricetes sp.]
MLGFLVKYPGRQKKKDRICVECVHWDKGRIKLGICLKDKQDPHDKKGEKDGKN